MRYVKAKSIRELADRYERWVTPGFLIWLDEKVEGLVVRQICLQRGRKRLNRVDAAASESLTKR